MNASVKLSRTPRWPRRAASLAATALVLLSGHAASNAQPPDARQSKTVQGMVRSTTTAPMGEVDGAVLDDGTVIHWPPHLSHRFSRVVARGDRVRVSGWNESGPAGDTHFETQTLVNLRTSATASVNVTGPGPAPSITLGTDGASDFAPAAERNDNIEKRLKALESEIAQLRAELQSLRRQP